MGGATRLILYRSGEIPRYLAWLNELSNDHLKLVWEPARESAHESIRHGVLHLLQGLFPHIAKGQLGLINTFAHRLPKGEFDGRTLVLLKLLASATLKVSEYGSKKSEWEVQYSGGGGHRRS